MHNHDISTQSSSNESYANTDFSQYSVESNSNESRNNSYNPHRSHQKRLILTLSLTSIVFFAEVVGSFLTNSLSLLIDAGHMLTDISVLVASTLTAILMQRRPNRKRTWGWARLEVITAAAGALVLLFVGVYALVEACMRLFGNGHSGIHDVNQLLFFGLLGLIANVGSIIILVSRSNDNMNMRAAFLEVMNDALGSVAVVISAVVMMSTNWSGFDALAGGIIAILMIPRAIKLLKNASTVSTGMPIFMAHVVVDRDLNMDQCAQILSQLQDCLREHFPVSVSHTTFQLEPEGYTTPSSSEHHE